MKIFSLIALYLLFSACGKSTSSSNPVNGISAASSFNAQAKYNSMPGTEMSVSNGMVGGQILQKQESNLFCRKTGAVVPNPVYSYTCYQQSSTGNQAYQLYNSFIQTQSSLNFYSNGSPLAGSSTQETRSNDSSIICQKITVVYPNSFPSYTCYSRM